MTTAATSLLGLALPVTGELAGTWGDTVNNSITSLLDTAVAGTTTLSTDGDVTLSTTTLAANQARQAILLCSGARTAIRTITAPAQSKIYTIINATTGGFAVKLVGVGPTTGLTIPNGASAVVAWNGSDFIEIGSSTIGNLTVNGNLTVTGTTTLTGAATLTANPTLSGGTANGVAYLNGSKVLTTGSALTFDGSTNFSYGGSNAAAYNTYNVNNTSSTGYARILFNIGASGANGIAAIKYAPGVFMQIGPDSNDTTTPLVFAVNNGSEQMRLTSTGLGIGTSSPTNKFVVSNGGANGLEVKPAGTNSGTDLYSYNRSTASWTTFNYYGNDHRFYYGASNIQGLTLDSSGNLGIGTSSPGAKLDVQGTSGVIRLKQSSSGSATYYLMDNTVETGGKIWRFGYTGASGIPTFSLYNQTDNVLAWVADSSGNLGLGVTPSAWSGVGSVLQVGTSAVIIGNSVNSSSFISNAYYDGSNYKYIGTGYAARLALTSGSYAFQTAASGTAGNAITFTQAMTLDASGRLAIGTTTAGENLTINSANAANARIGLQYNSSALTYFGSYSGIVGAGNATDTVLAATGVLAFAAGGTTERARIDSSGNLLVGTTSAGAGAGFATRLAVDAGGNDVSLFKTSSNGSAPLRTWTSTTTGDATFVNFATETSYTSRGSITYNRTGGLIVYGTSSDYRSKDIIGPVTDSGMVIDSVPVYLGKMKGATQARPMFIAHETPEYAHTGEKDAVDADGNPVYQQMDASSLVPVLWAEVQSLRKRLAAAGIA